GRHSSIYPAEAKEAATMSVREIDKSKERPVAIASARGSVPPVVAGQDHPMAAIEMDRSADAYILAWSMALIFYVLEYSTRSAPGVMIPQLARAFSTDGAGVGNIVGAYYY